MQSRAMVILLSLLGCGLGSEARAETLPDVMVGLSLSIPFPKAPVRVGVQARGGPYFLDWTTGLLLRTGGRTFVDVGKDGVRFGLTGYGGWGWGDDWQPGIAVDAEGGFVVGSHRVPSGWVAGGRLEGGRLVRGSIGYQRIFPFAISEHAPVETLDVSLGASPISQVVWIVGRALRVNGEPQVAPVLGAQFAHRCAEADQRLKEAAEELAAVSTFIRTALELEALGAPAALVARCMGAAREEVHHLRDQLLLAGRSGLDAAHLEVLDPEPRRFGFCRFVVQLGIHEEDAIAFATDTTPSLDVPAFRASQLSQRIAVDCKLHCQREASQRIAVGPRHNPAWALREQQDM